jgi:hypothetical protein
VYLSSAGATKRTSSPLNIEFDLLIVFTSWACTDEVIRAIDAIVVARSFISTSFHSSRYWPFARLGHRFHGKYPHVALPMAARSARLRTSLSASSLAAMPRTPRQACVTLALRFNIRCAQSWARLMKFAATVGLRSIMSCERTTLSAI